MKLFVFILSFLVIPVTTSARGTAGKYYISGRAYNKDGNLIKNKKLEVHFKGEKRTIKTNSKGHYKIEIKWRNPCRSAMNWVRYKRLLIKENPKWIKVFWEGAKVKIKNKWRDYQGYYEPENTRVLDLHFK